MSATKLKTITVRVTSEVEERLLRLARELRRSRSSLAGEAIELLLQAREQPLITPKDLSVDCPRTSGV
jgi:predicted transcriptional regulator